MTTTDQPTTVSLTGWTGLLAAVPALLGFHPTESVVMLCLGGPRHRVGPVARIDAADLHAVPTLLTHARRHADEVAVIAYTARAGEPAAFAALLDGLELIGMPVARALLVSDNWVREAGPSRALQAWFRLPTAPDREVETITAAMALHGRQVLADRSALAASIAGPTGDSAVPARRACRAVRAAAIRRDRSDPEQLAIHRQLDIRRVCWLIAGHTDRGDLMLNEAAELAVLLADRSVRDAVIGAALDDPTDWLPALITAATRIPTGLAAELCALLAVVAYRRGDGALAQVAVDRVFAEQPQHVLALHMLQVMAAGLPPERLDELAELSPDFDPGFDPEFDPGFGAGFGTASLDQ